MQVYPTHWDWELMIYLNNLSPEELDAFWSLITHTKFWIPFYVLLLLLFFYRTEIKKGLFRMFLLVVAVGVTHLFTELTKSVVGRLRPNETLELMNSIKVLYQPSNFSFFSGHASTSFAATVFIYLVLKSKFKALGFIFIWPVLFSLSRIFVGVHFPSDVFVGAFIGLVFGVLFSKLLAFSEEKLWSVSYQDNT